MTAILNDDPLSSAALRHLLREPAVADGESAARPLALRFAHPKPLPVRPRHYYDPEQQVGVDENGRPLITVKKDWKTKAQSDGDEGPEEDWGWEE
jgi:putative ATP-grasp target RiPP